MTHERSIATSLFILIVMIATYALIRPQFNGPDFLLVSIGFGLGVTFCMLVDK